MAKLTASQVKEANDLLEELSKADDALSKIGDPEYRPFVGVHNEKGDGFAEVQTSRDIALRALRYQRNALVEKLNEFGIEIEQ